MSRSVYRRDGGWRLRWAILVAGDLLADCLAYLLAFVLRTHVPLPLTQGYLPGVRFAEVHHHWPEMLLAQGAVLYFLGLYEVHAVTRPRDHTGAMLAAARLRALVRALLLPPGPLVATPRAVAGLASARARGEDSPSASPRALFKSRFCAST